MPPVPASPVRRRKRRRVIIGAVLIGWGLPWFFWPEYFSPFSLFGDAAIAFLALDLLIAVAILLVGLVMIFTGLFTRTRLRGSRLEQMGQALARPLDDAETEWLDTDLE